MPKKKIKKQPKYFREDIKLPPEHKVFKKVLFFLEFICILITLAFAIYGVWDFFTTYSLRSPFQSPIIKLK